MHEKRRYGSQREGEGVGGGGGEKGITMVVNPRERRERDVPPSSQKLRRGAESRDWGQEIGFRGGTKGLGLRVQFKVQDFGFSLGKGQSELDRHGHSRCALNPQP